MAVPLGYREYTLALKAESAYGTIESMANTDATHRVQDAKLEIVSELIPRDRNDGAAGHGTGATGPRSTSLTFKNHMQGDGANGDPAWAVKLFPAVGMPSNTTNSYRISATQSNWASFSAALNRDGRRRVGRGFMGNLKITGTAGQPIENEWNFLGGWNAEPTDTAQLSGITFEDAIKPIFAGSASVTIDSSTALKINQFVIDMGTKPFLRKDPNGLGGYCGGWIVAPMPTLTIDPEAVTVATKDWHALQAAEDLMDIVFVANGGSGGDKITITCTDCQQNKRAEEQERDGMLVDALGLNITGTVTILFGAGT